MPRFLALAGVFLALTVGAGAASRGTGASVPPLALRAARMAGSPSGFAWQCSANLHQIVVATTYLRQRRVLLAPKLCRWLTEPQTDPARAACNECYPVVVSHMPASCEIADDAQLRE